MCFGEEVRRQKGCITLTECKGVTKDNGKQTIQSLAEYVCSRLEGKAVIHRYDAYSTNSVYLKFDYGLGNSLRISDHSGKKHLSYRFNIILDLVKPKTDCSGKWPRSFYPPSMVDQVIWDILAGIDRKRSRYRDYDKTMRVAAAKSKNELGFWTQARLVSKPRIFSEGIGLHA